jgi:type III restriction enzyme
MPRVTSGLGYSELHLPPVLEPEVDAWSKQGWTGVTQTTHDLLSYWFNRDEETEERFYFCQQRAIETIIYCHEVLRIKTLGELYERLAPEAVFQHLPLKEEVESIPFPKFCLKMATGTGKLIPTPPKSFHIHMPS